MMLGTIFAVIIILSSREANATIYDREEPDVPESNLELAFARIADCKGDPAPTFRGRPTDAAVVTWNVTVLTPWAGRKGRCLESAGRLLLDALPSSQEPEAEFPTARYILALARVGNEWVVLGRELSSLRYLTFARVSRGLIFSKVYQCRSARCLDSVVALEGGPWRQRAQPYFEHCVRTSTRLKQWDGNSDKCDRALARHWKHHFSELDEIRPSADQAPAFRLSTAAAPVSLK
jgi:hypothetical protein